LYWYPQPQAQNDSYGIAFATEVHPEDEDLIAGFVDVESGVRIRRTETKK
jgi:hypothetical protein